MANSKIIIVEGAQGVGKTTCTDFLRHSLKYTNLYRLSGTNDNLATGLKKSEDMYYDLMEYIKKLENKGINLLFDRTFFTEECYCRCGFKEYSFTKIYDKLLSMLNSFDFDIYYITLFLEDTNIFKDRLDRKDKAVPKYAEFKVESSIKQQNIYLDIAKEVKAKCNNINVINISTDKDINDELKEIFSI